VSLVARPATSCGRRGWCRGCPPRCAAGIRPRRPVPSSGRPSRPGRPGGGPGWPGTRRAVGARRAWARPPRCWSGGSWVAWCGPSRSRRRPAGPASTGPGRRSGRPGGRCPRRAGCGAAQDPAAPRAGPRWWRNPGAGCGPSPRRRGWPGRPRPLRRWPATGRSSTAGSAPSRRRGPGSSGRGGPSWPGRGCARSPGPSGGRSPGATSGWPPSGRGWGRRGRHPDPSFATGRTGRSAAPRRSPPTCPSLPRHCASWGLFRSSHCPTASRKTRSR